MIPADLRRPRMQIKAEEKPTSICENLGELNLRKSAGEIFPTELRRSVHPDERKKKCNQQFF